MSDNLGLLDEYAAWVLSESINTHKDTSPKRFLAEHHTRNLLRDLKNLYAEDPDTYQHSFGKDDIDWLNAQEFFALSVDGEV